MRGRLPDLLAEPLWITPDPPTPPPDLAPDSFAARLYAALGPLAQRDPEAAWSLLIYVNAIGTMFQVLDVYVRDTPEGPGWSPLLDLDRCPAEALPYLAQFVGVRLLPGATEEESRARIASTDGFKRGTPAAMRGAAIDTLTGAKRVVFRERYGDPYALDVLTFTSETPDPAMTLRALVSQKPGGIVLSYRAGDGQDYQLVKDTHATYADVKAAYATYSYMIVG
jgi:Phage tail protein (Tail_P2_I)